MTNEPVVVFTGDQDWAPDWALEDTSTIFSNREIPYHLFRTNRSPILDEIEPNDFITFGWHPNFLPNSSHGSTIQDVIQEMERLIPNARSVRCHSFYESSAIWSALSQTRITAESHGLTFLEPYLGPFKMWSGLVRYPVFFEDDHFYGMEWSSHSLKMLWSNLELPGLKIMNFHPIHVALNTPSATKYAESRNLLDESIRPEPYSGRGIRCLLFEILEFCAAHQLRILSFHELMDEYEEIAPFHA